MTRSVLDSLATIATQRGPDMPRALHGVLAATERWSTAELERHQLLRLARLLRHARATVPFYAAWPDLGDSAPTLDAWRTLPLLGREDVRERAADLVSRRIPPEHRIVREANSSGSTGRHVTVQIDAVSDAMGHAIALRDAAWHGREPRLRAAGIRAIVSGADAPLGREEPRWLPHPDSGPLFLLDVHTPVREQLAWLARVRPAYLATYASNAAALVAQAEQEGLSVPGLREVGTFGEALPDGLREACRRVWGVPVVDAYSCVELGYLALQCSDSERYHVQSEDVLVEILRDDGSACSAGETGRVVVSALHAFAMPLLRYDIGDFATVGAPCSCGRGLPVLDRIVGRARNLIRLPSGDRIWPRFGSNVLGGRFPVKQFRLRQLTVTGLVLELVVDRPLTPEDEAELRAFVLAALRYPFDLELAYVDALPRSAGGKFEDVISELDADAAGVSARSAG